MPVPASISEKMKDTQTVKAQGGIFAVQENPQEESRKSHFLTFHLAAQEYGIETRYVTEVIGLQKITVVPDMPGFIRGMINLRGKLIPVMEVRRRFHLLPCPYDERTAIVVVNIGGSSVGLVVDEVLEEISVDDEQIAPPPPVKSRVGRYILGVARGGAGSKILLDIGRLLSDDELEQLDDATHA